MTEAMPQRPAPSLAASLSTVGYAMFALLKRAPLAEIESLDQFMARTVTPVAAPAPGAVYDDEQDTFLPVDVGEQMAAVISPVPAPAPEQVAPVPPVPPAPQPHTPAVPVAPVAPVAPVPVALTPHPAETPEPEPPEVPEGFDLPQEYSGKQTFQMLSEISFLDE